MLPAFSPRASHHREQLKARGDVFEVRSMDELLERHRAAKPAANAKRGR